jgi:hypothetical protein
VSFAPTHEVEGTPVVIKLEDGRSRAYDKDGNTVPWKRQNLKPYKAPPAPEAPTHAYIHADAAMCILKACCFPQWENAVHTAQSPRGDDARVLNERGPNGEKVVRISERNPDGRKTYKVFVPKQIAFEIAED